jgi:hypothetical protein
VKANERQALQDEISRFEERCPRGRWFSEYGAVAIILVLAMGVAPASIKAQQSDQQLHDQAGPRAQTQTILPPKSAHRFFDKTNLTLFAGVAAVRTLDYTSTQHFRRLGNKEVLLTNSIVDNRPLFAGIEVAGTALSIGAAYWLHRTGHHKLEQWVSIVHIGVGAGGDAHNYSLGPAR